MSENLKPPAIDSSMVVTVPPAVDALDTPVVRRTTKATSAPKKATRQVGDPMSVGDTIIFTAAYLTYHPEDLKRYEKGVRYETVITENSKYTLRLFATGTFIELPE